MNSLACCHPAAEDEALLTRWRQVRGILARLRRQFPGARVHASTFDDFVGPLATAVADGLRLPVVTDEASVDPVLT